MKYFFVILLLAVSSSFAMEKTRLVKKLKKQLIQNKKEKIIYSLKQEAKSEEKQMMNCFYKGIGTLCVVLSANSQTGKVLLGSTLEYIIPGSSNYVEVVGWAAVIYGVYVWNKFNMHGDEVAEAQLFLEKLK